MKGGVFLDKINTKHQRDIGYTNEQSKHKKKSQKNGLKRSKHKHEYIWVRIFRFTKDDKRMSLAKVCTVCNKIGNIYFLINGLIPSYIESELKDTDINKLPVYMVDKFWGKFAYPSNTILEYEGHKAEVHYSQEDDIVVGHVLDIEDSLNITGRTYEELTKALKNSIEDYFLIKDKIKQDN